MQWVVLFCLYQVKHIFSSSVSLINLFVLKILPLPLEKEQGTSLGGGVGGEVFIPTECAWGAGETEEAPSCPGSSL